MDMGVDSTAILIAVCFIVLGLVALPIFKFILGGGILLGVGVAILFRALRKKSHFFLTDSCKQESLSRCASRNASSRRLPESV